MSHKNKLQEICQKNGEALPRYTSRQVDGPAHSPVWQAEVVVANGDQIVGERCRSKVEAEQSAAKMAIERMQTQVAPALKREPVQPGPIDVPWPFDWEPVPIEVTAALRQSCLLIDGENLPNLAKAAYTFARPDLDIVVFVGYHHHMSERDYGAGVQKVLVPTTHANGVDSCMQIYVGTFLTENRYDRYLVATRDHFGSALVDLIRSSEMPWSPQSADLVTTIAHLEKHIA